VKRLQGLRTLTFGLASLVALLAGFWLLPGDARGAAFAFLCAAVGALMAAVAGKSAVGSLAQGGGTSGAWRALTTSEKPETPPAAPPPVG
jgi:hypothetical protein